MNSIPSKSDNPNGLHARYYIERVDGKPIDSEAEFFILRLDDKSKKKEHVNACRMAILTYADEIAKNKPEMARELYARYNKDVVNGNMLRPELHI